MCDLCATISTFEEARVGCKASTVSTEIIGLDVLKEHFLFCEFREASHETCIVLVLKDRCSKGAKALCVHCGVCYNHRTNFDLPQN